MKKYARENRSNPTDAEIALWNALRAEQQGHKFYRQYIIGDYIVDFLCKDDGLVIEVDGAYHSKREQEQNDEVRTQWLEGQGYRVIRFTNEEVLLDLNSVIDRILNELDKHT